MLHKQRIQSLQQRLIALECDALFVEDKTNLFYLTGLELSAGKLLVATEYAFLFVDGRYFEMCQEVAPVPVRLTKTPSVEEILVQDPCRQIKKLGFDTTLTTYKAFQELQKAENELGFILVPLEEPIGFLRLIKDSTEISTLREAASLGSLGCDYVLTLLKEGVTELEVAQELEIFWKRRGSKSLAFDPIIAFGSHSSMPHYRPGNTALKRGDIVLIDIGVNYHHYNSDMTRTVFFGEPDSRLMEIYLVVKDAQEKAVALCCPGETLGNLDKAARNLIAEKGFGEFFTHSLGHGVGLDIHEAPWVRDKAPHAQQKLEPGMVITIEPGIYLPGLGGVRIEDTVVITSDGYENLTKITKEVIVI